LERCGAGWVEGRRLARRARSGSTSRPALPDRDADAHADAHSDLDADPHADAYTDIDADTTVRQ
jgi:hypothetical protein